MLDTQAVDHVGQWDFKGCDTQYGTHGIHTYVAAMIPQLARKLIERFVPRGGPILDPFCGGGSVLVEAVREGHAAIGRDVNHLAAIISKAKTTPIDLTTATRTLERILADIPAIHQPPILDSNMAFWFKPEHAAMLHALRQAIFLHVGSESRLYPFFLTVFSATVRDVSLTYRNEVRLRRMTPKEVERFKVDPITRFKERCERAALVACMLPEWSDTDIDVGNAQSLGLSDKECSAIVCSPPYGDERNGVSYSQFSKNMLGWLGYAPEDIKRAKALTLGWGKQERAVPSSPTLQEALEGISDYRDSIHEAVAFYADYQVALAEMARVTCGPIIVVIGQRVLRDTIFDNGAITVDLMKNVGVSLREVFYRQLPSKRLPRMRKFGAAINRETILVFEP